MLTWILLQSNDPPIYNLNFSSFPSSTARYVFRTSDSVKSFQQHFPLSNKRGLLPAGPDLTASLVRVPKGYLMGIYYGRKNLSIY